MPQLMPFFWINSTFMIIFVLMTLTVFYCFKNLESMNMLMSGENNFKFYLKW